MAAEVQIETNRGNAQKITGPRTEEGEARYCLDALDHVMRFKTESAPPVLPQEDPRALEAKIAEWVEDFQPRGAAERDLVVRAARLYWVLERAERYETALLTDRVRRARERSTAERIKLVQDLGKRLFAIIPPDPLTGAVAGEADDPRWLVHQLEETAEGRRWLLDRWAEFRALLDRELPWSEFDQFKFVRLLGKQGVAAVDDPALNAVFLAWNVLEPGSGSSFWESSRDLTPNFSKAFATWLNWRTIAPNPPADRPQALALLRDAVEAAIARLAALDAEQERRDENHDDPAADLAAFDPSTASQRLHQFQTARGRELLQTLDKVLKLRKARGETTAPATASRTRRPQTAEPTLAPPPRPAEPARVTHQDAPLVAAWTTGEEEGDSAVRHRELDVPYHSLQAPPAGDRSQFPERPAAVSPGDTDRLWYLSPPHERAMLNEEALSPDDRADQGRHAPPVRAKGRARPFSAAGHAVS